MIQEGNFKKLKSTIEELKKYKKVLFLTCSNRYQKILEKQTPKSTILAIAMSKELDNVEIINVPDLKIYPCEGNVSHVDGNSCGVKKSELKDKEKNPTGHHRCWRNINNPDDELWKISKELFESDAVVFFGSVRWGQMNGFYQHLIERLTWLENRHSTLGESNIIKDISCGIIATGQNFNGSNVIELQKEVLKFFGFDVKDVLCWNWQYSTNVKDETQSSYKKSAGKFNDTFGLD